MKNVKLKKRIAEGIRFLSIILPFTFLIFNCQAQLPTNNIAPANLAVMADTNANLLAPTNFFAANSNLLNASIAPAAGAALLGAANVFAGPNYWTNPAQHLGFVITNGRWQFWTNGILVSELTTNGHIKLGVGSTNLVSLGGLGNTVSGINWSNGTSSTNVIAFIIQQTNVANITSAGFVGAGSQITSLTSGNLVGALPAISGAALTSLNGSQITSGTVPPANGGANGGGIQGVNDLGTSTTPSTSTNMAISPNGYAFWANGTASWNGRWNFLGGIGNSGHQYLMPSSSSYTVWWELGNPAVQNIAQASVDCELRFISMNPFVGSGSSIAFGFASTNGTAYPGTQLSTNTDGKIIYVPDAHALGIGFIGDAAISNNAPGGGYVVMNGPYPMHYSRVSTVGGVSGNYPYLEWDGVDGLLFVPRDTTGVNSFTNSRFQWSVCYNISGGGGGGWVTNNNLDVINNFRVNGNYWALQSGNTNTIDGGKIDETTSIKITKIYPHFYTTASSPLVDVGNNGSGIYFQQSDGLFHFATAGSDAGHIDSSGNWVHNMLVTATNGFSSLSSNLLAPASISPTGSPFKYTNSLTKNISVFVDAGTVSAIAINGTTIFTSTGKIIPLQPNEYVTVTYTGAPTMTFKPF